MVDLGGQGNTNSEWRGKAGKKGTNKEYVLEPAMTVSN